MKKGLLLSIVASTVLFAGGDIAPVQPVAEAPAAACNDFYGAAGVGVVYNHPAKTATYGVAAVLGVTKNIFDGVTVNAEVQGVAAQTYNGATSTRGPIAEAGGLTQLNLGFSFGNTAIKVGRFAIDGSLSPLVKTGTDYFGLKKNTFEGIMVANTDIADTVVYGAYLYNSVTFGTSANAFAATTRARVDGKSGAVALGVQNKSFADTTITAVGYYFINSKEWKAAGSIDTKLANVDFSLGGAYDHAATDYVVGAYAKDSFGPVDATIAATYSDKGMAYGKYTDLTDGEAAGWAVGAKLGTTFAGAKLSVGATYRKDKRVTATVGISKTYSGINFAADYKLTHTAAANTHRVRAKAVYKF